MAHALRHHDVLRSIEEFIVIVFVTQIPLGGETCKGERMTFVPVSIILDAQRRAWGEGACRESPEQGDCADELG